MSGQYRPARRSARPGWPTAWIGLLIELQRALQPPLLVACLAALLAGPAWAQYKVVGPDGSVTYTDRPPTEAGAKVQAMRRDGSLPATPATAATAVAATAGGTSASAAPAPLPFELRSVVARFPVTLYSAADCAACASARALLVQRGVPFAERSVASDDDIAALQRLTGGRSVPSLTIGAQAVRGLQESDWQSLLDLAGYPRESRLPRGWSAAPASPLVARNAANATANTSPARPGSGDPISITGAPPAGAADTAPPPAAPSPAASAGIRF